MTEPRHLKLYRYNGDSNKFRPSFIPTTCPKCGVVYCHQNKIKECQCCDWKDPNWKDDEN